MKRQFWRLYRQAYGPGLDGVGGTMASGRWHTRGQRVVYCGLSAAIVVLERLAHTDPDLLPTDLQLASFEFTAEAALEDITELPANWTRDIATTQALGADWIKRGAACGLVVPSAIVPEDANVMLNATHAAMGTLRLVTSRPFTFDSRLL